MNEPIYLEDETNDAQILGLHLGLVFEHGIYDRNRKKVFCVYCSLSLLLAGARLEQRAVSVQTNSALSCFPFPLHCPLVGRLTRHWQAKR